MSRPAARSTLRLVRWPGTAGVLALGLVAGAGRVSAQTNIAATRHNLSVSGPGAVRATTETEVCVFCHTPHSLTPQSAPLWNRQDPVASYVPYTSASLQAGVGQPNGYSKLCLSCHDGTIAIGTVLNLRGQPGTISMQGAGAGGVMPAGAALIGTTLSNDHPVSFTFDASVQAGDGELADPMTLTGLVQLYAGANPAVRDAVQCTSCHDPHTDARPKFLRKSPKGQVDNLCLTCHQKPGWAGSTHESSTANWPAGQSAEQVRDHSCVACHAPHTADGAERLLRDAAVGGASAIEQVCYTCHRATGGGGIAQDVQAQFAKSSRHPVTEAPGDHRPVMITRPPLGLPENVLLSPGSQAEDSRFTDARHVECVDCHNPHRVRRSNRTEGMRGIALDGSLLDNVVNDSVPADGQPSTMQYPVCLRCHGDTWDRVIGVAPLPSGATPSNKRTEFQTSNSAFHPVGGPGRNNSSNLNAQLAPNGLSTSSVMKCTDCHNNNAYENTTGRAPMTGTNPGSPVGPHGSTYPSILRARYWTTLPGPSAFSAGNFNLCFRCHDVNRLMARRTGDGARTNFYDDIEGRDNLHWVHLNDRADRSQPTCKSCHYSIHSNVQAANTQYNIGGVVFSTPPPGTPTRLVNFHPNIRPIGGRAKPEWWLNPATRERRCYLQCHQPNGQPGGTTMNGLQYRPASGDLF